MAAYKTVLSFFFLFYSTLRFPSFLSYLSFLFSLIGIPHAYDIISRHETFSNRHK